jgi:hypothetical protein
MEQVRKIVTEKEPEAEKKINKFHVSILGFSKKEVEDYLAASDTVQKTEAQAYERKLAEQSAALSMALREKETLAAQNAALNEKLKILTADSDGKQSELAAENYILKARIADLSDVESKNSALISKVNDLAARCEHSEAEKKELQKALGEKEEIIIEQCRKYSEVEKKLKIEIEQVKAEAESTVKVYKLMIETARDNLSKTLSILEHE